MNPVLLAEEDPLRSGDRESACGCQQFVCAAGRHYPVVGLAKHSVHQRIGQRPAETRLEALAGWLEVSREREVARPVVCRPVETLQIVARRVHATKTR